MAPGAPPRHRQAAERRFVPEGLRPLRRSGETEPVSAQDPTGPGALAGALAKAMNAHDIEAFVSVLVANDESQQPVHPDRAFQGRDQARANWSAVFSGVPDFHAEILASVTEGATVWTEWRWRGTQEDGSRLHMVGVIIFDVRGGRIARARLYVEPVEHGEGIDAAVREMSGPD